MRSHPIQSNTYFNTDSIDIKSQKVSPHSDARRKCQKLLRGFQLPKEVRAQGGAPGTFHGRLEQPRVRQVQQNHQVYMMTNQQFQGFMSVAQPFMGAGAMQPGPFWPVNMPGYR